MIKSCAECKTKCCKAGPGPYKVATVKEWTKEFTATDVYNKVCEHFDLKSEKCQVWGTDRLPAECRNYVCQIREFSSKELEEIKKGEQVKIPFVKYERALHNLNQAASRLSGSREEHLVLIESHRLLLGLVNEYKQNFDSKPEPKSSAKRRRMPEAQKEANA